MPAVVWRRAPKDELIGERVRDKIAASKRKGIWVGGPVPLGYAAVDKKILVVAAEAEAVRTIFQRAWPLAAHGQQKRPMPVIGFSTARRATRSRSRSSPDSSAHELPPTVGTTVLLVNPSNRVRSENLSRDLCSQRLMRLGCGRMCCMRILNRMSTRPSRPSSSCEPVGF